MTRENFNGVPLFRDLYCLTEIHDISSLMGNL